MSNINKRIRVYLQCLNGYVLLIAMGFCLLKGMPKIAIPIIIIGILGYITSQVLYWIEYKRLWIFKKYEMFNIKLSDLFFIINSLSITGFIIATILYFKIQPNLKIEWTKDELPYIVIIPSFMLLIINVISMRLTAIFIKYWRRK